MFGPDWTFRPDAPALSHAADAPVPRAELIDIVTTWPSTVQEIAARCKCRCIIVKPNLTGYGLPIPSRFRGSALRY